VLGGPATAFAEPIAEGLRNTAGVLDDYRILGSPWGFDPGGVTCPVTIWQGDRDGLVPPAWAARLAERIAGVRLTVCPGEGHFLTDDRYVEIFAALRSAAPAAA
jgi:pimeloyl-ACP methyl ester carboxylesterase